MVEPLLPTRIAGGCLFRAPHRAQLPKGIKNKKELTPQLWLRCELFSSILGKTVLPVPLALSAVCRAMKDACIRAFFGIVQW